MVQETQKSATLENQMARLIARAAYDEKFKKELLSNPGETLKKSNIAVKPNVEVRFIEDSDKVVYIKIPRKDELDLSDAEIAQITGGRESGPFDLSPKLVLKIFEGLRSVAQWFKNL